MTGYPYLWKDERCALMRVFRGTPFCTIELESRPGQLLVVPRSEVAYRPEEEK